MDLQLAHLQTLAAVARHGSFSHAARELHLTQPAVSMQVRQLEQTLGLPLLERVGKRAFPTKAGELLLAHAGRALRELESEPLILFEQGATLRRVIDNWFHRAGAIPALPMELGNTEAIKKLVEAGLGRSVTSWFSVSAEVRARKLAAARLDPPLYREIGVILRRDKPRTPVLEAFLSTLDGLRRSLE